MHKFHDKYGFEPTIEEIKGFCESDYVLSTKCKLENVPPRSSPVLYDLAGYIGAKLVAGDYTIYCTLVAILYTQCQGMSDGGFKPLAQILYAELIALSMTSFLTQSMGIAKT